MKRSLFLDNPLLAAGLILFGIVLLLSMLFSVQSENALYLLDHFLVDAFQRYGKTAPESIIAALKFFGRLTSEGTTILAVLLGIWWLYRRKLYNFSLLLISLAGGEVIWLALIFWINRPRPQPVTTFGNIYLPSFPSGHTELVITFYGLLLYLYYPQLTSRRLKLVFVASVILLVLLTGFSRLVLAVHYLTDVLGGYGMGIAWTVLVIWFLEAYFAWKED